jgi:hypothetical protein
MRSLLESRLKPAAFYSFSFHHRLKAVATCPPAEAGFNSIGLPRD